MPKPATSGNSLKPASLAAAPASARRSSGMLADLANKNLSMVRAGEWGTDLDIQNYFRGQLANSEVLKQDAREDASSARTYIFPPVSLTENAGFTFASALSDAINAVKENQLQGAVSLRFLVNDGDEHWLVAEIEMHGGEVIAANLWNSLSGDVNAAKQKIPFQNFSTAVQQHSRVIPNLELAGIQHNGYSCMDYSLQKIDPKLAGITDAAELRFKVIKQIVANHTEQSVADSLTMDTNGNVGFYDHAEEVVQAPITAEEEARIDEGLLILSDGKAPVEHTDNDQYLLSEFDAAVAKHLAKSYKDSANKNKSDVDLLDAARTAAMSDTIRAMRIFGFFSVTAKQAAASSRALDVNQPQNTSSRKR
jgi:hypothetical protein